MISRLCWAGVRTTFVPCHPPKLAKIHAGLGILVFRPVALSGDNVRVSGGEGTGGPGVPVGVPASAVSASRLRRRAGAATHLGGGLVAGVQPPGPGGWP